MTTSFESGSLSSLSFTMGKDHYDMQWIDKILPIYSQSSLFLLFLSNQSQFGPFSHTKFQSYQAPNGVDETVQSPLDFFKALVSAVSRAISKLSRSPRSRSLSDYRQENELLCTVEPFIFLYMHKIYIRQRSARGDNKEEDRSFLSFKVRCAVEFSPLKPNLGFGRMSLKIDHPFSSGGGRKFSHFASILSIFTIKL